MDGIIKVGLVNKITPNIAKIILVIYKMDNFSFIKMKFIILAEMGYVK